MEAYRHRLELDAGALGMTGALEDARAARTVAELDLIDLEVQREASRRPVWMPSSAQLEALEDEAAEWVCECAPDVADELEELLQVGPDTMDGPTYRAALEDVRELARECACNDPDEDEEAGFIGPFAQPSDIARQIEAVDAEVLEVDRWVREREASATAPAQRDAVMEWYAWSDAWGQWCDSDPSTWWGATLTELDAWRAELAGHRQRLEAALAGTIPAPVAEREVDPVTRAADSALEVVSSSSSSLGLGLGLAFGAGLLLYAAATGKLGGRSAS